MSQIQLTLTLLISIVSIPLLINGQCNPNPCLNNGTCLPDYKGKGFKCKCLNAHLLIYGPRCEWANRGFHLGDTALTQIQTVHSLAGHEFHKKEFVITFEFIAELKSRIASARILVMKIPDDSLFFDFKVVSGRGAVKEYMQITYMNKHISAILYKKTWNWTSVKFNFTMEFANIGHLPLSGSFSSVSGGEHFQQWLGGKAIEFESEFNYSTLAVGPFDGCIRFVRVNNKLVDLGNVLHYRNSYTKADPDKAKNFTSHFCFLSQKSCLSNPSQFSVFNASWSTKCGRNSRCDGFSSGADISAPTCSCKCESGKRRLKEPWINDNKCLSKLDAKDECIMDIPILSTASANYKVSWSTMKSNGIRINLLKFSIEFSLLTKEANVQSVLMLKSFGIIIKDRHLQFYCYQNGSKLYYNFPKIQVSDDIWHAVSVNVVHQQLTLMIDFETQFYDIPAFGSEVEDTDCMLNIPNSCIKGLRVSDLYMPLNTTEIIEDGLGDKLVVQIDTGVSVGTECDFTLTGFNREQPEKNRKSDDSNKKSDDSNKKSNDNNKKSDDSNKKFDDSYKKSDDSNKKSDDSNKKSDDSKNSNVSSSFKLKLSMFVNSSQSLTLRASWMAPIILSILVILLV